MADPGPVPPVSATPGGAGGALAETLSRLGIKVGGNEPWDVQIHDERTIGRVLRDGTLGAGESYVEGWWDCDALDDLAAIVLRSDFLQRMGRGGKLWVALQAKRLFDLQWGGRGRKVAEVHYDLGNHFFEAMLGPSMSYSCGFWRDAADLDAAQHDKHELICRKLELESGDRVLDIGCGWGSFARHAASHHGSRVTGITISSEQATYARSLCADLPVDIRLLDYRALPHAGLDKFDKIVSVGMFEHVGAPNFARYLRIVADMLVPSGLFLLHTISRTGEVPDRWINRYIFPNSYLPTMKDIVGSIDSRLVLEDLHNFGADYDKTLGAWHHNFERWAQARGDALDARFYRMWHYYLMTSAGCFRCRCLQLWQLVFSSGELRGGYASVR